MAENRFKIVIDADGERAQRTLAALGHSVDKAGRSAQKAGRDFETMERGAGGAGRALKTAAAAATAYVSVDLGRRLVWQADAYGRLQTRIKVATRATGDYVKMSRELFTLSQQNGVLLRQTVDTFQSLARAAPELNATNREMLTLTDLVQKLARMSGAGGAQLDAGLLQFGQAMSAGIVRAEELNSLVENLPELANRIARGMDMTTGQLRKAVLAGKVLSKDVFESLIGQAAQIREEFAEMPQDLERSTTQLSNAWDQFLGKLEQSTGIVSNFATTIRAIAGWLSDPPEETVSQKYYDLLQKREALAEKIKEVEAAQQASAAGLEKAGGAWGKAWEKLNKGFSGEGAGSGELLAGYQRQLASIDQTMAALTKRWMENRVAVEDTEAAAKRLERREEAIQAVLAKTLQLNLERKTAYYESAAKRKLADFQAIQAMEEELRLLKMNNRERAEAGHLDKLSDDASNRRIGQARELAAAIWEQKEANEAAEKVEEERERQAKKLQVTMKRRAKEAADNYRKNWQSTFQSVEGYASGFFEDLFSGGDDAWGSLMEKMKADFIRMVSEMLAYWTTRQFIMPMMGMNGGMAPAYGGSGSGMMNLAGNYLFGGGGGGGFGGAGGWSPSWLGGASAANSGYSAMGGGGVFAGATNSINAWGAANLGTGYGSAAAANAANLGGGYASSAAQAQALGPTLTSYMGAAGVGAFGGSWVAQQSGGNPTTGAVGGGLGAMGGMYIGAQYGSWGGPIGMAIGAIIGGLVGGAMGGGPERPNHPSYYIGASQVDLGRYGRVRTTASGGGYHYDGDPELVKDGMRSVGESLMAGLSELEDSLGLTRMRVASGPDWDRIGVLQRVWHQTQGTEWRAYQERNFRKWDGSPKGLEQIYAGGSFEDAFGAMLVSVLKTVNTSVGHTGDRFVTAALRGSQAETLEDFIGDLDFAKSLSDSVAILTEAANALDVVANQSRTAAQAQAAALFEPWKEMQERAREMNMAWGFNEMAEATIRAAMSQEALLEELTQSELALASVEGTFNAFRQAVDEFGLSIGSAEIAAGEAAAKEALKTSFEKTLGQAVLQMTDLEAYNLEILEEERAQLVREATALGADLLQVEAFYQAKKTAIITQAGQKVVDTTLAQIVQLQGLQISNLSPMTLGEKLDVAQASFDAAPNLQTARDLLGLGQSMWASSTMYQDLFDQVTGKLGAIPGFAGGGYHPGGLAWVGEDGPELLDFTAPARIYPHDQSMAMAHAAGGLSEHDVERIVARAIERAGGGDIHLTVVTPDGKEIKRETIKEIKNRSRHGETVIYANGVGS